MRPTTRDTLANVATVYRVAVVEGRSPVDAVAAKLGISYSAAKQRIYRARRHGFDMTPRRGRVP